jgi:hypothetical protein
MASICKTCKKDLDDEKFKNCQTCREKKAEYKRRYYKENPDKLEDKREYTRKKREDPEYQEQERQYIRKKREDPEYKAKELEYMMKYCEKRGLTYEALWKEIKMNRG